MRKNILLLLLLVAQYSFTQCIKKDSCRILISELNTSILNDSTNAELYYNRACLYIDFGKKKAAIKDLQSAQKMLFHNDFRIDYRYGQMELYSNNIDKAIGFFENALNVANGWDTIPGDLYYYLGYCKLKKKNYVNALAYFNQVNENCITKEYLSSFYFFKAFTLQHYKFDYKAKYSCFIDDDIIENRNLLAYENYLIARKFGNKAAQKYITNYERDFPSLLFDIQHFEKINFNPEDKLTLEYYIADFETKKLIEKYNVLVSYYNAAIQYYNEGHYTKSVKCFLKTKSFLYSIDLNDSLTKDIWRLEKKIIQNVAFIKFLTSDFKNITSDLSGYVSEWNDIYKYDHVPDPLSVYLMASIELTRSRDFTTTSDNFKIAIQEIEHPNFSDTKIDTVRLKASCYASYGAALLKLGEEPWKYSVNDSIDIECLTDAYNAFTEAAIRGNKPAKLYLLYMEDKYNFLKPSNTLF